jgi:hypothetical protein
MFLLRPHTSRPHTSLLRPHTSKMRRGRIKPTPQEENRLLVAAIVTAASLITWPYALLQIEHRHALEWYPVAAIAFCMWMYGVARMRKIAKQIRAAHADDKPN